MQRQWSQRRWWWIGLALGLLILIGLQQHRANAQAGNPVLAAWQAAQQRGSYAFSSDVTQTTTPLATIQNVGRKSRTSELHLDGQSDLRKASLALRLWSGAGGGSATDGALQVEFADGKTRVRQSGGVWQEEGDLLGSMAPNGDFLSFLAGLREVKELGVETRAGVTFTRYGFTLDGPALTAYLRAQTEAQMQRTGQLPPGVELQTPPHYAALQGHGELWVDGRNLPLRLSLNLTFPPQRGEVVTGQIVTTFRDFAPALVADGRGALHTIWLTLRDGQAIATLLADLLPTFLLITGALGFGLLLIVGRRSRALYASMVIAIIFAIVAGPLLQNRRVAAYLDVQSARAASFEQQQQEQDATTEAQALVQTSAFDPTVDPVAAAGATTAQQTTFDPPLLPTAPTPVPLTAPNNNTDTDGDGLTDFLEERVATSLTLADTDGDGINDGKEVLGFQHAGRTWFSDPLQPDSNRDGQGDAVEMSDFDGNGRPEDSDNDGTPDAFDDDNDGDGVVDARDLSPYSKGATTFSKATPFQYKLDNLQAGKPVYVDLQLRPTDEKHLWYALNVLDWPLDTEAQYQDGDGATFADVAIAGVTPTAADNYGDLKLLPFLEIQFPTTSANLPPQDELIAYNVSVNKLTADGANQVAYLPLRLVSDPETGMRVAFQARMPYRATGQWAQPHQVRLVWLVQALLDQCAEQVDGFCVRYTLQNQPQVIQSYYEGWTLTGFNVREEHGSAMALIYEDPAADSDLKDDGNLMLLTRGLDQSFLTPRDQNQNGQRDVTVNELVRRFNRTTNSAVPATERWNMPNTLRVEQQSYSTLDQALMSTAMTETVRVLNSAFAAPWQGDKTLKPLILFAHEDSFRVQGLDALRATNSGVQQNGALLTINLTPGSGALPVQTGVGLKLNLFCAPNASAPQWQSCDFNTLWDELFDRYATKLTLPGDGPLDAASRMGILRLYALALVQGLNAIVQQGAIIALPTTAAPDDSAIAGSIQATLNDLSGVVLSFINDLGGFIGAKVLDVSFTAAFGEAASKPAQLFVKLLSKTTISKLFEKVGKGVLITALVGALVVTATIIGLAIAQSLTSVDTQLLTSIQLGVTIIRATILGLLNLYSFVSSMVTIVNLVKFLGVSVNTVGSVLSASSNIIGTSTLLGAIGAVVQVGIVWGFFLYNMISSQTTIFSPSFNAALAQAIAATILIITLAVLSATVIGAVILSVIAFIDTILTAICELGVKELTTVPGMNGACFTLNGVATQVLTKLLYSFDSMIDSERADMVVTGGVDTALGTPEQGYVSGNPIQVTLPVTTTLVHKDPKPENFIHILPYLFFFSPENMRSSTVNYSLTLGAEALTVERDRMNNQWIVAEDHRFAATPLFRGQHATSVTTPPFAPQPGLNRSTALHFNMGYAFPAYECWTIPNIIPPFLPPAFPVCYVRSLNGNSSTPLDQIKLDILPPTLDGFTALTDDGNGGFRLNWDTRFPTLADADGDGLASLAMQGLDPNDNAFDSDGDGLSDLMELEARQRGIQLSPIVADSDNDGLTDAQELAFGTNPTVKDTDNDGLLDSEELYHQVMRFDGATRRMVLTDEWAGGWTVAITGTQPLNLLVSSSPTLADSDLDGISDQAEKELALHTNPSKRLDPDGRPYQPLVVNRNPLVVLTAVNDSDRIVKPGQSLRYQTSVTNLGAPFAAGGLEVRAPALLGTPISTFKLELDQTNVVTKENNFTVAANAAAQVIHLDSLARARLVNLNPVPLRWLPPTPGTLGTFSNSGRSAHVAPANFGSQDRYAVALVNRNTSKEATISPQTVFRGDVRGYAFPGGQPTLLEADTGNITNMRNDTPADVACNENGRCFYVWDEFDNCQDVIFNNFTIRRNDDPSDPADIAVYLKRNTTYLRPNEAVEPVVTTKLNMPVGNPPTTINNRVDFCGPNFDFTAWEFDGATPTSAPAGKPGMFPLAVVSRSSIGQPGEDWVFRGAVSSGLVEVNVDLTRLPEKPNVVMGSIYNSNMTSAVNAKFAITNNLSDTQTRDYRPTVATDGEKFLVVWERVSGVVNAGRWTMSSQIIARQYGDNGVPQDGEKPLGPPRVVLSNAPAFSPESFTEFDLIWVGDAYRLAWRTVFGANIETIDLTATGLPIANSQRVAVTNAHTTFPMAPRLAFEPNNGRILMTYFANNQDATGVLWQNRHEAGSGQSIIFGRQIGRLQPAYHPVARKWLLAWFAFGSSPAALNYELRNLDGSPFATLPRQQVALPLAIAAAEGVALACPASSAQPALQLPFEELPGATTFADSAGAGLAATCSGPGCPLAGIDGAPNAPLSDFGVNFNGVDQSLGVTVPGVSGQSASIVFWMNSQPLPANAERTMVALGADLSVALRGDKAVFVTSAGTAVSTATVADGNWHHIAAVKSRFQTDLYVDGQLSHSVQGQIPALVAPLAVRIGSDATNSGFYPGALDHLLIYDSPLDQSTVQALLNRAQNSFCLATSSGDAGMSTVMLNLQEQDVRGGVIKARSGLSLTVDANPPTAQVTSLSNNQRVQGSGGVQTLIIGGSAEDAFGVAQVEVSIDNGPFVSANGSGAWNIAVNVGDGQHTIRVRAIDKAGNVQPTPTALTFFVDSVAPQLTTDFGQVATSSQGATAALPIVSTSRNQDDQWTVFLAGGVGDSASGNAPGSGIAKVETLLLGNGNTTAGNDWQPASINSAAGQWGITYSFDEGLAVVSGVYTVTVRAYDNAGNSQTVEQAIYLDQQGPDATLSTLDVNRPVINSNVVQVSGVVSDVSGVSSIDVGFTPIHHVLALSNTLMLLPFDEADAIWFEDRTPFQNDVRCAVNGCALSGEAGRHDQAVGLTGDSPLILRNPQAMNFGAAESASFQAWVRTSQADAVFLSKRDGNVGYALRLQGGRAALELNGTVVVVGNSPVNDNQWHHLVGVVDRTAGQAQIFVDGRLQAAAPFTGDLTNAGQVEIGGRRTPAQAFVGLLDEAAIFNAALTPFLVQGLFQTTLSSTLQPAQLSQAGATTTGWRSAVPAGLEGQYQIDILSEDTRNNQRLTPYLWRGLVDTLAPHVTFTATATGRVVDNRFEIAYGYRAEDRHLDDLNFSGPCGTNSALIRSFAEDADMGGLFPELTLRDELRTSCTVLEANATPAGVVTACDIYQNCATQSPTVTGTQAASMQAVAATVANPVLTSAVISPTNQSIIALYPGGGLTVTVAAAASDSSPLREVVILLDDTPVQTLSFTQEEAARKVERIVRLPLANIDPVSFQGVHTLTTRAADWAGAVQQTLLPVNITVDTQDPVITFDHDEKMTAADTVAFGNSLLRYRGRASDSLGLATVQMRVNGGKWADVTFDENGRWHTVWWMGDEPAGKVYDCDVRAIDRAGRVSNVSKALLIDLPVRETLQTVITAQPERVTKATEATFAFTGADNQGTPLTRFQCQIDGEPLAACTSPVTYRGLNNDEHVFRVFAMNESGQLDPTPATYTWTVDDGTTPLPPPVTTTRRLFLPLITRNQAVAASAAASEATPIAETVEQPATATPVEPASEPVVTEETPVELDTVEPTTNDLSPTEPIVDVESDEVAAEGADQNEQHLESSATVKQQIFLPVVIQ
jgi:hypothetical protein